jgi:hypothetical protein
VRMHQGQRRCTFISLNFVKFDQNECICSKKCYQIEMLNKFSSLKMRDS